ncbi:phosphate signaling complex protein PhoU [Nocardia vermiculata]|uniref:Phosphate-specific transport system accessory protein PhoU n=1 Tax=Nocardia vermiculata TaxID=257274 RepID=A0A846Y5K2_9NOCA|nr:phosphate signaling complex protein PhoU [Nocardia vermiculata]NKY53114.1 phosphate signaling complex protein PhoU [Nocardia vermiculata]
MRVIYNEQMADLATMLGEMAGLAGAAMDRATQSLLEADIALAEQVITEYDRIAEMIGQAEEKAFALLALQAPVAGDLRQVISAIQIVSDVNRMGVLALHVAKVARRRHPNHALPESVNGYFAEMGRIAVNMGAAAKEVLETRDPERAAQLNEDDEAMDDLHRHLFSLLMDREWKYGVAAAVDVTLLGRYYERFADHAVEIGRRVVFLVTGVLPPDTDAEAEKV